MDSSSKFFFSFSVNYVMIVKLVDLIVLLGSKLLNHFRNFQHKGPLRLKDVSIRSRGSLYNAKNFLPYPMWDMRIPHFQGQIFPFYIIHGCKLWVQPILHMTESSCSQTNDTYSNTIHKEESRY